MSAKTFTLNNGESIPAIGECGLARVSMLRLMMELIAFGGWGGLNDKERDQFAPTFGLALKVGSLCRIVS